MVLLGSTVCGQEESERDTNNPEMPGSEPSRMVKEVDEELPDLPPDQSIPWQDSLLELPAENGTEQDEVRNGVRPANQGGGLFPPAVWPLMPDLPLGPLKPVEVRADGSILPEDGTEETRGAALNPQLLVDYFGQRPQNSFLDPQHLLNQAESEYMESLLRRWLNDGNYRATMLLFAEGQAIPEEVDPSKIVRKWFGAKEAHLLVCFFMNQPERTGVFFVPEAVPDFRKEPLKAALSAAIREAGRARGGVRQMQRFSYKTKVRLHRMDQKLGIAETLRKNRKSKGVSRNMVRVLTAISIAGLVLASFLRRSEKKKRRVVPGTVEEPVFLPEQELHTRLGAPHGGGFSAVITFAPAARSRL